MDYTLFNVEDFVTDEYFIQWVKAPTAESNGFWLSWLSNNPHKRPLVERAREIILLLDIEEKHPPEGKFLDIWEGIIRAENPPRLPEYLRRHSSHKKYLPSFVKGKYTTRIKKWQKLKQAAAIAFLLLSSFLVYRYINHVGMTTIQTAYGESNTFFLPDSTKVTLNYNSGLRYARDWMSGDIREVWLSGEAFFSVVHQPDHQKFRVNTNELQVEVLGTQFNVNSRRGHTRVVLDEGKVRLKMEDEKQQPARMDMLPGDFVVYSGKSKNFTKKVVNPKDYTSWRNNKLTFTATSFSEIGQLLEDNYGLKVEFANPGLQYKKFTGSSAADNPDELFEKLMLLFDLTIVRKKNRIIVKTNAKNPG